MQTIIITGHKGFIGTYATAMFINQGFKVIGIDKQSNIKSRSKLLEHLIYNKDRLDTHLEEVFEFDLSKKSINELNIIGKENYKRYQHIDCLIHLASPVGVKSINLDPHKYMKEALEINLKIDSFCEEHRIPLIYASSSEVFGENDQITPESNYNINQSLRSSYALQKASSEILFRSNEKYSNINVRFFNIYGYGQDTPGMVVQTFINSVFNKQPLEVHEDSYRTFYNVNDAVNKLFTCYKKLANVSHDSKVLKESYNIGSLNESNYISIYKLAELICELYQEGEITTPEEFKTSFIKSRRLVETGFKDNEEISLRIGLIEYMKLKIQLENFSGEMK